ncbi:heparin/heparin-sulfate lyase HepB [Flavivirga spongiicola]|uniref:Heparinase II/III family protein n=1 Tax=Flavivirga spongiicola TaxID=421621 RepID=A0ABU7XW80_9FLAO|nr:heparin/heparin-sulfate lyase HepB [Flavivirga sp. MEBiC05379]MDO5980034.1 heparinase II/III family protein [Flavivirga sp. MEBiC05379]
MIYKVLIRTILIGTFFQICGPVIAQNENSLKWESIDGISIPIPPSEHPRLYLRAKDIPDLKKRISNPKLQSIWNELVKMSEEESVDDGKVKGWRDYVKQQGVTVRSELNAIRYLTTGKKVFGRQAIKDILTKMQKSDWPHVQDIARAFGRMMVSGAIVYDWCHDLLTENEKQAFIAEFLRMAKRLECGYPPVKQSSVTGHSSEWMIMRDLLSASIAIYDEFPEMYHLAAGRFFREHLPVRNWFYPGEAYHQGAGYSKVRQAADLYPLWIFDRMGAGNVYNPSQQYIPYHHIYSRRPDGQFLASGDVNYSQGKPTSMALVGLLSGSYYKDEYVNNEYLKRPNIDSRDKLFEFLWKDTELGKKTPSDLPLTKYFGAPYGWMIARTGWNKKSVIAEMKINEYQFNNHQHLDAGAFQIYYKGPLAIDSGIYSGSSGGYNSDHNKNYFKRSIAHNSLLIYDPNETFKSSSYGGSRRTPFAANDGGQRMPGDGWSPPVTLKDLLTKGYKTGEILAREFGPDLLSPDYSYLKGDITKAYSKKVKEVKRSFTFLNLKNDTIPAVFIVFDKVVSSNPSFQKTWLLHSIEKPKISNNETTLSLTENGYTGKLVNTTLIPELDDLEIKSVGGPGKDFWVRGTNYNNTPTKRPDIANERGAWRIEVTPKTDTQENYFLNVMQIMDNDNNTHLSVKKIDGEHILGIQIQDRIVCFNKWFQSMDQPFSFSIQENKSYKILLTDLKPGHWQIIKDNEMFKTSNTVNEDGTLYFEGTGGNYKLIKK